MPLVNLPTIVSVLHSLGVTDMPQVTLVDADSLTGLHTPPFPPALPAIVFPLRSVEEAAALQRVLAAVYPAEHSLQIIRAGEQPQSEALTLGSLPESALFGPTTALYLPALDAASSFEAFQEVIAHLRAPNGCPWDREQTHSSLRPYLLEEAYEALAALDAANPQAMREEFGDLLLQIVLHAQIASEGGAFNMADVLRGIHSKIVRRHPHVFGEVELDGVGAVLKNWEKLKAEEREGAAAQTGKAEGGLLDGVPVALPALSQALEIQRRAARVGFDWPNAEGVLDKICEEAEEIRQAGEAERGGEIGDLLFAVVNLARWFKVDAESALRETSLRFRRRFAYVEQAAKRQGRAMGEMTLAELDALWEEAKRQ